MDIQDISEVALKYNVSRDSNLFINRFDLNLDGIIDIFIMVYVSKYMN